MELVWTEARHGTGDSEIDAQHKELFRQVNNLLTAMRTGKGKEELDKILKFLGEYAVSHFSCEEKKMETRKCSACDKNKAAHAVFLQEFQKFMQEYNKTGASSNLVLKLQNVLCKWLDEHIAKIDTCLGNG